MSSPRWGWDQRLQLGWLRHLAVPALNNLNVMFDEEKMFHMISVTWWMGTCLFLPPPPVCRNKETWCPWSSALVMMQKCSRGSLKLILCTLFLFDIVDIQNEKSFQHSKTIWRCDRRRVVSGSVENVSEKWGMWDSGMEHRWYFWQNEQKQHFFRGFLKYIFAGTYRFCET